VPNILQVKHASDHFVCLYAVHVCAIFMHVRISPIHFQAGRHRDVNSGEICNSGILVGLWDFIENIGLTSVKRTV